jgi:hypothetical protein
MNGAVRLPIPAAFPGVLDHDRNPGRGLWNHLEPIASHSSADAEPPRFRFAQADKAFPVRGRCLGSRPALASRNDPLAEALASLGNLMAHDLVLMAAGCNHPVAA